MWSEVPNGVISPVVAASSIEQMLLVHELVHGQQLDRGHAERRQILDRRRMCEAGVGTAKGLGHAKMPFGEALDVDLVNQGLVQTIARGAIVTPIEGIVHDYGFGHVRSAVAVVALQIVAAKGVRKDRLLPVDAAADGARVGIDQQLRGIAAHTLCRVPRTVHAIAVTLPRADATEVPVPAERAALRQVESLLVSRFVEETQLDALSRFGEQREVRAAPIPARAERKRVAGANDASRSIHERPVPGA